MATGMTSAPTTRPRWDLLRFRPQRSVGGPARLGPSSPTASYVRPLAQPRAYPTVRLPLRPIPHAPLSALAAGGVLQYAPHRPIVHWTPGCAAPTPHSAPRWVCGARSVSRGADCAGAEAIRANRAHYLKRLNAPVRHSLKDLVKDLKVVGTIEGCVPDHCDVEDSAV